MCGLFGLVRAKDADAARATQLLLRLGVSAEERGVDSSGLALALPGRTYPTRINAVRRMDVRVGQWRVVKGPGRFRDLTTAALGDDLDRAWLVLGHTRWATQGRAERLTNTSPLIVDTVVGTHNGDIEADLLREQYGLDRCVGETDTAVLLAALDLAGDDPAQLLRVLSDVVGRAALAWSPLSGPRQLWLARGGLSPLAVVRDEQGNLFWASNPQWLRRAAHAVGVRLPKPPTLLQPGLLTRIVRRDGLPHLDGWWQFKPTVRVHDIRHRGVWRGFTTADQRRDQEQLRHHVHAA